MNIATGVHKNGFCILQPQKSAEKNVCRLANWGAFFLLFFFKKNYFGCYRSGTVTVKQIARVERNVCCTDWLLQQFKRRMFLIRTGCYRNAEGGRMFYALPEKCKGWPLQRLP